MGTDNKMTQIERGRTLLDSFGLLLFVCFSHHTSINKKLVGIAIIQPKLSTELLQDLNDGRMLECCRRKTLLTGEQLLRSVPGQESGHFTRNSSQEIRINRLISTFQFPDVLLLTRTVEYFDSAVS